MDIHNKIITIKSVTIKSMPYIIKIKHEEMKHFQLGYCMTVHCSQGSTLILITVFMNGNVLRKR